MTKETCVQACIDAVPPAKNYDCWSVEFITNVSPTGGGTNCRTQSKTLFGSDTGYRSSPNTDLYERSCKYVDYLGVNKQPEDPVPYTVIHTPIPDPTPYGTDYAARFDVEYEVEINDATKPYFLFNFTPYSATCIYNCKIDLTLTIDGE